MEDGGWLFRFPEMSRDALRDVKQAFDFGYRDFSRTYGEAIENVFDPLLYFLVWFEDLFIETPWPLIILGIAAVAWLASRSWKLVVGIIVAFLVIGYFGMWEDTMRTMAMIVVCTILALVIGLPIGILMSRYDRAQAVITPIPVVMLLGIGRVPGLLAVIVYAVPPMIRLTNLGIRLVDKEVLEAADAFGASYWQRLFGVQIPLAMPNIMAGVNQTIMMALAMVVIASMIGVRGLGQPVLRAVTNQYFALGLFNGLAIVALAIVFDRVTQAYGRRLQEHAVRHD